MDLVLISIRHALLALLGASLVHGACAAGNAAAGQDVFAEQCSECHSVKEGKHKKGPSLYATIGRPAAQLVSPDSGQIDKAPRPPVVVKRCCQRG